MNLLTDSNRLLREERKSLSRQVSELEASARQQSEELQHLRESTRTLVGQKDALVAEKTALRLAALLVAIAVSLFFVGLVPRLSRCKQLLLVMTFEPLYR